MSERDALMRNIVENPDEDAPRLVFADWCQENGDEDRAEFIRVQIERARLDEFDERHQDLEPREVKLLARHRREWTGNWPFQHYSPTVFRRGFIERLEGCGTGRFNEHIDSLLARHPVREAWLEWPGDRESSERDAEGLLRPPRLSGFTEGQLRGLGLNHRHRRVIRLRELERLLASVELRGVRRLVVPHVVDPASPPGFEHVLFDTFPRIAKHLEALRLPGSVNRPRTLERAVRSELADTLTCFGLEGADLDEGSVRALTESSLWCGLTELDLGSLRRGSSFPTLGLAEAVGRSQLRRLNVVSLSETSPGEYVPTLCRSERWGELESLKLSGPLHGDLFREFVNHEHFARLRRLHIHAADLDAEDATVLAEHPNSRGLRELVLYGCPRLDHHGVARLVNSPQLSRLVCLDLDRCPIGEETPVALARSPHMSNLRWLGLGPLSDAGVRAIADSPFLGNLTRLVRHVDYHQEGVGRWTIGSIIELAESERLPHLTPEMFPDVFPEDQKARARIRRLAWEITTPAPGMMEDFGGRTSRPVCGEFFDW